MSYPLNDEPAVFCIIYYILFGGFTQLVIDGRREADGGEKFLSTIFHFDEVFGTEDFFEALATEIRDGKNTFGIETGFSENVFDVFGMVIVKPVGGDFFVVGDFLVERINFGTASDIPSHLGQGAFVGYFDNGDAAWL